MNQPADAGSADEDHNRPQHPLLADPARLQKITGVMHTTIQRTLFGLASDHDEQRGLLGGEATRDVLQQALLELLGCQDARNWEGLGVRIARLRAIDALRRATRGRRRRDATDSEPDRISVLPVDVVLDDYLGTPAGAWWDNPEQAYEHHEQVAALRPLIRTLPEPARTVVVELVMNGRTRAEIGRELGLTGQRVGQILTQTLLALRDQASRDPKFASYFVERKKP